MNTDIEALDQESKQHLTPTQRFFELSTIVGMLLLFWFLEYHRTVNSGFFTEKFGSLEMLCLYGPIFLGMIAPLVRIITGHRNPARPYEAATSILLAFGSFRLLTVFPFEFAHLADTLPQSLHFALAWVTNDISKILLVLQITLGPISALVALWRYFATRRAEWQEDVELISNWRAHRTL